MLSTVRSESCVEDISGQQESCATALVRHIVTNLVLELTQKSPKCKCEGAAGVDGERDEFQTILL